MEQDYGLQKMLPRMNFFFISIYIDPGGSLPNFLIDLINKTSVVNIFKDAIAEAQKRHRQKLNVIY